MPWFPLRVAVGQDKENIADVNIGEMNYQCKELEQKDTLQDICNEPQAKETTKATGMSLAEYICRKFATTTH